MSRLRLIMLAALAVFAVSAVASASASAAAPEFIRCVKVKVATEPSSWKDAECKSPEAGKGKYIRVSVEPGLCNKVAPGEPFSFEKGCAKAGGEYAMVEKEAKRKFTDKEGVSHLTALGNIVTCQKDTSKGEITGNSTIANVTVTFEECKAKKGTEECAVNGGTIKTETLSGELGTVAVGEAASGVGEDLKPPAGKAFVKLEGTCIVTTSVEGSVIGEVKPVGGPAALKGELNFECKAGEPTKQKIQKFETGAKDTLSAFGTASCFESFPDVITFEEPIEVI